MNSYTLEAFSQEVEAVFAEERPDRAIAEMVGESLRKLSQDALYLDERPMRRARREPIRTPIYQDPRGRFVLVTVAWPAGYKGPVHDHTTWGAVVGYRGRVILTSFRRTDDASEEGKAVLNEVSRQLISEGLLAFIRPPEDAIHQIENSFRDPALTVHIYGEDQPWANIYEPSEEKLRPAGEPEHLD
jgi:predicted metal-dependent enzyme (double-stranded beta helix superfamily)